MTLHPLADGDNPCETAGGPSYKQPKQEYPATNGRASLQALQTIWHTCSILTILKGKSWDRYQGHPKWNLSASQCAASKL